MRLSSRGKTYCLPGTLNALSLESWQQKAAPANSFKNGKTTEAATETSLSLSNSHNDGILHLSAAIWSFEIKIKLGFVGYLFFPNFYSNKLLRALIGELGHFRVITSATKGLNAAENL